MVRKSRVLAVVLLVVGLTLLSVGPSLAGSTSKILSTNFTLVNLGDGAAEGSIQYILADGSAWKTAESFTISEVGGQAIYRQYFDNDLADGAGSVIVSANQPLGAVVQILARGQSPTSSGAYSGISVAGNSFVVPLVARNLGTASGLGNSQIVVQNAGTGTASVTIQLINADGSPRFSRAFSIPAGASTTWDLADQSATNVPDNWYGSAVATAASGGQIAVVSNFFTGDAMQTFNAFDASITATEWFVPLFTSRLANSLSTPVAVQNVSGATIPANGIVLRCAPDPGATGFTAFEKRNTTQVLNTAAFYFNPVTDMTIPAGFYGSCTVEAPGAVVSFVQMRFVATGEAAAYEAIPAGSTETDVMVPLVAKRLPNGFATAVTIQNLGSASATVNLTYTPSPEYGGSQTPVVISNVTIPGGQSLIQNHRIPDGVPQLPDGWVGTLTVSGNQPLGAFAQLTFLRTINANLAAGDNFMAHNAFPR